jgi:uncharacterized repeat protein (TIGR01451 family)
LPAESKLRLVIATSVVQPPTRPVVPVPDDGLKPLPKPADDTPPAPPTPPQGLQLTSFQVPPAAPTPPALPAPLEPVPANSVKTDLQPPPVPPADPGLSFHAVAPSKASGRRNAERTASLSLEVVGPVSQSAARPFAYEIVVRNPGAAAAVAVHVREELPEDARYLKSEPPAEAHGQRLDWEVGDLEAGAERRLRVEVQAGREGKFQDRVTATCSVRQSLATEIQRPHLVLTMTGPERARLGEEVPFQVRVTNNGTGPATHVLVHDHLPAGLKHAQGAEVEAEVGTLSPGESQTVALPTTAVRGGRHLNEAVASADDGLEATARATVQVDAAVLEVRSTGARETSVPHELEQRLEVVNTGTGPATGVRLTDRLGEGLEFVAAGDGGTYTATARSIEWLLGTLEPGQSRALVVKLQARNSGDLVHQAVVRGDGNLEATAEARVHVEGVAALRLDVVDLVDPVEVGGETTYEVRVRNQGTGVCSRVQVQAVVPDGMTIVAAEPDAHRVEGQRVVFDPVARLQGRADAVFRVRVRAKAAGDWRFKAYLSCEQLQRPVYGEESTQVYDAGEPAATGPAPPGPGSPEDIPKRQ